MNPREIAMKVLLDINTKDAYSNIQISNYVNKNTDIRDENLLRELVYGVLENKIYIDYMISKTSKIKIKKIHSHILEILRIGIYQIMFMDKIPESAAVDESVKLAKKYGHKGTIGYVNGMLRNIIRNKEDIKKIDNRDKVRYLSIKYSYEPELVKRWIKSFGYEFTEELLKANNKTPSLNIRVNTLKIDKDKLMEKLNTKGVITKPLKYAKDGLKVKNPNKITNLDEFKEGLFTIQDESSMLVSQVMDPEAGSLVLDVCSAPGGKATHIAQMMDNRGKIISRDIYPHKLELIRENSERLGIENIVIENFDALKFDEALFEKVDYLLLDAPCSGFGLIRRKPEIKYNRGIKEVESLAKLQYNILSTVKDYVKTGGFLIYSTCTIEAEENILNIKRFLKANPEFHLVSIEDKFKDKENLDTLDKGYVQLFPNVHGTDGFFIAKLEKR